MMTHFNSSIISIIYANIQNPLCNFVAPCPRIIRTKFQQNLTNSDEQEKNFLHDCKITASQAQMHKQLCLPITTDHTITAEANMNT